jgi:hypothetical protein
MNKLLSVLGIGLFAAGCGPVAEITTQSAPVDDLESICEIVHYNNGVHDPWGVYGWTEQPRGTVFEFVVEVDGEVFTVPLLSRMGSVLINEKKYGDDYKDDGTNVFGNTTNNMVGLKVGHGPVYAQVTLNGDVVCSVEES